MKNEMFYGEKWDKNSVEEFISIINQYMQWYRDKRIKLSLGGLSPMEYRRSLGIAYFRSKKASAPPVLNYGFWVTKNTVLLRCFSV